MILFLEPLKVFLKLAKTFIHLQNSYRFYFTIYSRVCCVGIYFGLRYTLDLNNFVRSLVADLQKKEENREESSRSKRSALIESSKTKFDLFSCFDGRA